MPGPEGEPFQYAVWRVIPQIERGECINAGVVLYCRTLGFLGARVGLDRGRLRALAPEAYAAAIERHLATLELIAAGSAVGGSVASLARSERFQWLVAPSSTVIQPSPVHTGLCREPSVTLDRLFARLVQ